MMNVKKIGLPFWIIVVLPVLLAIIYYGVIAANQYVSVSNFVVRSPQKSTSVSGLSAVLQSVGFASSQDDAQVVSQYIISRDAVRELEEELNIRDKFQKTNIDFIDKFDPLGINNSLENLYEYYKNKVTVDVDTKSSISTLTVKAYDPKDAYIINNRLLEMAERLVNKLNQRGRDDTVSYAEAEVKRAQDRLQDALTAMMRYRADNKVVDIEKEALGDVGLNQMGLNVNSLTFKTLIDGIYNNKLGAVIREISSNARDAHIKSENTDPFEIILDTNNSNLVTKMSEKSKLFASAIVGNINNFNNSF